MESVTTTFKANDTEKRALINLIPYQLPPVVRGQAYEAELEANGGAGPLEWGIVEGNLPAGFQLNGNRIFCARVQEQTHATLTLRVKDSDGMTSDAQTLLSSDDPDDVIAKVRQRGTFLFSVIALVIAGGGLLLTVKVLTSLEEYVFTQAMRLRTVIGVTAQVGSPDWYAIAVLSVVPFLLLVLLATAFQWQRRKVNRHAREIWGASRKVRRFTRIEPVPESCLPATGCRHCEQKHQYLTLLLGSRRWEGTAVNKLADGLGEHPVSRDQYIRQANAVFAELRKEIAERAFTCGLLVGIGRNRWFDAFTIAASSFEMQMFVLHSLGKQPGVKEWWRLLRSSAASMFVNAYLNLQDIFLLNLLIKQGAWGLQTIAGASDSAAAHLHEGFQHHTDNLRSHAQVVHENLRSLRDRSGTHLDASDLDLDELHHGMNGVLKLTAEVAAFSLSTGTVALNQIAAFVEHHSGEMVQGVLAGGILYWHGCNLAGDILAINQSHRRSAELRVTVFGCAQEAAKKAGVVLQAATRGMRSIYRERRMRIVKSLFGKKTWSQFLRAKP
jgi:hypothetical protein